MQPQPQPPTSLTGGFANITPSQYHALLAQKGIQLQPHPQAVFVQQRPPPTSAAGGEGGPPALVPLLATSSAQPLVVPAPTTAAAATAAAMQQPGAPGAMSQAQLQQLQAQLLSMQQQQLIQQFGVNPAGGQPVLMQMPPGAAPPGEIFFS